MRRYITHRVLQGIVTIWLVTLGVFSVLRLTGDPVSYMLPPDASKEDRARLIALYGFNDPLWKQYLVFNNNLLHGRFGPSLRWDSRDALEVFLSRLPATLALTGAAMSFSIIVGIVLGAVAATAPIRSSTGWRKAPRFWASLCRCSGWAFCSFCCSPSISNGSRALAVWIAWA